MGRRPKPVEGQLALFDPNHDDPDQPAPPATTAEQSAGHDARHQDTQSWWRLEPAILPDRGAA